MLFSTGRLQLAFSDRNTTDSSRASLMCGMISVGCEREQLKGGKWWLFYEFYGVRCR